METIVDRKKQPRAYSIDKIELQKPEEFTLDNGIQVFTINSGAQDLIKIEMIFPAGNWHEPYSNIAYLTNNMLIEGTKKRTANQIAEKVDYYGAYLETNTEKDNAYISLYLLNKHLKNTLPVLQDIIMNPIFPENELTTFINKQKQQFVINNKKVNYLARVHFNHILFGNDHPYGKMLKLEDFDNPQREDLVKFHKKYYTSNNCKIIVAGKLNDDCIIELNKYLGGDNWKSEKEVISLDINFPSANNELKHFIEKPDAIQSAIRIGKKLFNKTHTDYFGLQVLNTVLGGYFGSRLMTNIRENKGFTYGIGSALVSLMKSGYFFITSEVGAEVSRKAIYEVYKEIKKLREELIPADELELVRNYMIGVFLRSVDGPFALSEKIKNLIEYDLKYSYYDNYVKTIKNIKAEKLKELAETYLNEDNMVELLVGKSV